MRYGIAIDVDLSEFKITQIQDYLESIGWACYNKKDVTILDLVDDNLIDDDDVLNYAQKMGYNVTSKDVSLDNQLDPTELWTLIDFIDKMGVKVGSNFYSTRQKLHEAAIKHKDW